MRKLEGRFSGEQIRRMQRVGVLAYVGSTNMSAEEIVVCVEERARRKNLRGPEKDY